MNYKSIAKTIKSCQNRFKIKEINGVPYLCIDDKEELYLTQKDAKSFQEFLDKDMKEFFDDINILKKYNLNKNKWIEFINHITNSIVYALKKDENNSLEESVPYLKALLEVLRELV